MHMFVVNDYTNLYIYMHSCTCSNELHMCMYAYIISCNVYTHFVVARVHKERESIELCVPPYKHCVQSNVTGT